MTTGERRFAMLTVLSILGYGLAAAALAGYSTARTTDWLAAQTGLPASDLSETYPLGTHAVAMAAVFAATVVMAALLVRCGRPATAAMAIVGAAIGPLSLTIVPLDDAMVADTLVGVAWSWAGPIVVVTVAWLALTVWLVSRAGAPLGDAGSRALPVTLLPLFTFAVVLLLVMAFPGLVEDPGHGPIASQAILGWLLVISAGVPAGWESARLGRGPLVAVLLGAVWAVTIAAMYLAYNRPGGWPGVAGWETAPVQSPLVLSVTLAVLVVAAPVLGWAGGRLARTASHARVEPSSTAAPA